MIKAKANLSLVSRVREPKRRACTCDVSNGLLAQLDEIKRKAQSTNGSTSAHEELLALFNSVEDAVASASRDIAGLQSRTALMGARSAVLDLAASLPATTMRDCAFKLALWRHDYVRSEDECWPRGDIVAASALDDLIALSGAVEARFTEEDEDEGEFEEL